MLLCHIFHVEPRLQRQPRLDQLRPEALTLRVSHRLVQLAPGKPAGEARARMAEDLSESEVCPVLGETVDLSAHLMSDEGKSLVSVGEALAAHDTVRHSEREYARGASSR